jgi:hypothetical protein
MLYLAFNFVSNIFHLNIGFDKIEFFSIGQN